ncbi:MAG: hypothetical protein ACKV2U_10875 [Bryobacteraceae bacterium]
MNPLPDSTDRTLIISYLLGQLEGPAKEEFEERYFTDAEFFEELQSVENELIDDFLQKRLPAGQRSQFEKFFRANPHRWKNVEFARAIQRQVGSGVHAVSPGLSVNRRLAVALAFGQVLILGFAAYLYSENRALDKRLATLSASLAPPPPVASAFGRLILQASEVSKSERGATVIYRLSKDVAAVEVTLVAEELPAGENYSAVLLDADGKKRASHDRLAARTENGTGRVTAVFAATHLPQGSYVIRLNDQFGRTVRSFPFNLRVE